MKWLTNIFLTRFFFVLFTLCGMVFILAAFVDGMRIVAQICTLSLVALTIVDALLVFMVKEPIVIKRSVNERLNLGDANEVELLIENNAGQPISARIYEGFPIEMQERSKVFTVNIKAKGSKKVSYEFTPKQRGEFNFNNIFVMLSSIFFLVSRRIVLDQEETVKVYPSVRQLKKYELLVFHQQKVNTGLKKIRRLGNNSEFEQIKNYVQGDEIKKINWKATSRTSNLMVNQYQEEKSQNVYFLVDKSRSMQMEFNGLSMLDYAINSTLVLSNITLKNGDKTGLITFSDKISTQLAAEKSPGHLRKIMEALYGQRTHFREPNYELLFQSLRKTVRTRSLLVLYSNFETEFAMRRALPVLRKLNEKHVLVVVFFQNTDIQSLAFQEPTNTQELYQSIIAEKMLSSKEKMASELKRNGIHTVLTLPENLSLATINKYLEIKAKGAV